MYIPGRPQVESFLYNRSRVSNMLHASSFYMALLSIFFPLWNIAQLSVKELPFFVENTFCHWPENSKRFATPGWQCTTHIIIEKSAVITAYFDFVHKSMQYSSYSV
jgi:hypothetical protein